MVVDVGNTDIIFALHDGTDFLSQWRLATNPDHSVEQYYMWIVHMCDHAGCKVQDIDSVITSEVVPVVKERLIRCYDKYLNVDPIWVEVSTFNGLMDINIDRLEDIGADRLVNSYAARSIFGNGLIIVDFGTATTFDIVDVSGVYVGGVIAPGVKLSMNALSCAASKLPQIELRRPEMVVGKDTVSAMLSGIYWGYVSMVDGMCARIRKAQVLSEDSSNMQIIATGGLSSLFSNDIDGIYKVDQDLTIKGLVFLYNVLAK